MKMKNITGSGLVLLLGIILLFLPSCRNAVPQKKNYLIGIINPNQATQEINHGFKEGLAEAGYLEGQNTTFITATSSFELDQVVQDMVAREVDLIFTVTTPVTKKAIEAARGKNIPVVYAMQDPVSSGLITSLAKPGSNYTGVQIRGSVPKSVELLVGSSPGVNHLFVPIKHDTKAAAQSLEDLRKAAAVLEIKLTLAEVNDQSELSGALANIPADADAIFILHSIFIHSNTDKLVKTAVDRKMLIGSAAAQSDHGVTISYGMIPEKVGRQASHMANLILRGTPPGDIPSESAEFFLGVNLKTAEAAGIEIPPVILQQADIIVR